MRFVHHGRSFDIEGFSEEDHLVRSMEKAGVFYEADLLDYMRQLMNLRRQSGKTLAIDVGANVGNHSIYMASFVADAVICIEPNPVAIALLQRNLAANAGDYSVYDCAVGETDGFGRLFHPDHGRDNLGMAKVEAGGESGIRVTTLDFIVAAWMKERQEPYRVSAVKIDVEGMELPVLKGAESTLSEHRPDLFVEAVTPEVFHAISGHLRGLGYRTMCRRAATPVYHFAFRPGLSLTMWARASHLMWIAGRIRARLARMFGRIRAREPFRS